MDNAEPKATTPVKAPLPVVSVREWVQLARGFYFVFFGGITTVVFIAEMLMAMVPRSFSLSLCTGSLLALLYGAWQLSRVRSLGAEWVIQGRVLLLAAGAMVYLFPFFWLWRQVPRNVYFCCHGLGFLAVLMLTMMALSVTSASLARALGRKGLMWQMVLCLVSAVVVQLGPFFRVAQVLGLSAVRGEDSVVLLQVVMANVHPFWVTLWLLPFTLSLSLVWTAKDIALEQLLEPKP